MGEGEEVPLPPGGWMPIVMSHRPGVQAATGVWLVLLVVCQVLGLHEIPYPGAEGHKEMESGSRDDTKV